MERYRIEREMADIECGLLWHPVTPEKRAAALRRLTELENELVANGYPVPPRERAVA